MQIYQVKENSLNEMQEAPFLLEKEIQKIFESNLFEFTALEFIKSEFSIKSNRIDTLAFDPESQAFVIIEYKRDRNYSVIDQGVSYLNLMLEYKADFIVEYNESRSSTLKRQDVDWSQSRIIFVSPSFTDFQKQSTNFKGLGIELWEIKRYTGGILTINPLQKTKSAPPMKQIQNIESKEVRTITKEIIQYDEDYHLENKPDEILELYEQFKNAILNLDSDLDMNIKKMYIAFKKGKRNCVYLSISLKQIRIWLNMKFFELDDPKKLARDVTNIGHWGGGDCEIVVNDAEDIEYILSLIKQTLKVTN